MTYYENFCQDYKHPKLNQEKLQKLVDDFIEWKSNVFCASWKKEYFTRGCRRCGSKNLQHYDPDYEGRSDRWSICPTQWKIECLDCGLKHHVITNDDNNVLDDWTEPNLDD